jgi:hypothetical protein
MDTQTPFKWWHFFPEVIPLNVRWYSGIVGSSVQLSPEFRMLPNYERSFYDLRYFSLEELSVSG